MGAVDHWCTPQASRLPLRGRPTPAMAAGITDHGWTVQAWLSFHVPPPRWTPPRPRGRPSQALRCLLERWCGNHGELWSYLRWSLLKKPGNLSVEEKQALAELEREDEGFVHSFRTIIRQLVNIFDHAHSEAQAKLRLHQLRQDIHVLADRHLDKIPQFFDDHWEQALRYLRHKGMGTHRRGANVESGIRLLRRLEKNHDGIRSAATRQHYIQIYQAIKYLSLDIAAFIEQGPHRAELPCV